MRRPPSAASAVKLLPGSANGPSCRWKHRSSVWAASTCRTRWPRSKRTTSRTSTASLRRWTARSRTDTPAQQRLPTLSPTVASAPVGAPELFEPEDPMTLNKFNLPDVGEGLTEAEIVSWKVKPGDEVAINDVLCEIETAKSLVELPSPFAGTVTELLVPEGATVDVGTAIISVSDTMHGDPTPADAPVPAETALMYGNLPADAGPAVGAKSDGGAAAGGLAAGPLVGSGPKADAVKRRPRLARTAVPADTMHGAP